MGTSAARTRVHHRVICVRNLNDTSYVLRFERQGLQFQPGQYLSVGPRGDINMREYSIYSPVDSEYLEILVKEVEGGYLSRKLRTLKADSEIYVEGPFGFFLIDEQFRQKKIYLIGTGTGISPFHCFIGSYSHLNYTILHGIRYLRDAFDAGHYDNKRIIRCISREGAGDFRGRVSEYLQQHPVESDCLVYLCGNCDMIYESYDILSDQGVSRDRMFAEVYF